MWTFRISKRCSTYECSSYETNVANFKIRRDEVAHLVRIVWANCHAHRFDARQRRTAHSVIKCGTGCWALSPAQVQPFRVKWTAA
ncbi:unnamed protein product [Brassica oleracea var. botrytis]